MTTGTMATKHSAHTTASLRRAAAAMSALILSVAPGAAAISATDLTAHWKPDNELPSLMEFLDGREVVTPQDWEQRRDEIRDLLIEHFVGSFPEETPGIVSAQVTSDTTEPDGSRRRRIQITLDTPNRKSFEMAVWTPPGPGPFPLLLTAPRYYQLFWAEDALARGYAVCLYPGVDSHHSEANYPGYESVWQTFRNEYPQATWTEISTKGWLASRCLDYLLGDRERGPGSEPNRSPSSASPATASRP